MKRLILASASEIRAALLRNAGVEFDQIPARIDEEMIRCGLVAEKASPRDIADVLAEQKARQVSLRVGTGLVLGSDQILDFEGEILAKSTNMADARQRLMMLRGRSHVLHSAAVLYDDGTPVWRHVSRATLKMRAFSDGFVDDYLDQAGDVVTQTVGGYAVESLGIRLFEKIEGDYFGILGLPLLELLNFLSGRGDLQK